MPSLAGRRQRPRATPGGRRSTRLMDQRRVLLAFLLMAAVLVASQWWYARIGPPPDESAPADSAGPGSTNIVVDSAARSRNRTAREDAPKDSVSALVRDAAAAGSSPTVEDSVAASPIIVETPLYRLSIDPRGGTIRGIQLLRYPSYTLAGPVELIPSGAEFLSRAADLGEQSVAIDDYRYVPSDAAIRLRAGDSARVLTLTSEHAGGRIVQSYRFDPESYAIDYRLDLGQPADGVLVTRIGPRLRSNEKNQQDDYGQLRAVARVDGEILARQAKNIDEGEAVALGGPIDWAGFRNKYFLAMVLAPAGGPQLSAVSMAGTAGDSLPSIAVAIGAPIEQGRSLYRLYLGPQEYRRLAALNDGLDGVNQYGWSWIRWMITPFAQLIVVIMLWLHRFIPSYGPVLIVFAVLVRIIMWPLTTKSFHSIRAMQALQPEIQRIRERHKSDPQKMQQETMRLYKERKVNPMGGCLPNLIPMPILFALFFVFQSTIEFRGAPFLWLPDLSQPDPIYILPVLMGLTMMASTKLTATDPKMAAMTYVMPIVLTFVFLNLAAGLVLYYAISNVLTFAQQWWLKQSVADALDEA